MSASLRAEAELYGHAMGIDVDLSDTSRRSGGGAGLSSLPRPEERHGSARPAGRSPSGPGGHEGEVSS